jgi:hypothetical protein
MAAAATSAPAESLGGFSVGQAVMALDVTNTWCVATIKTLDPPLDRVKVHFPGWNECGARAGGRAGEVPEIGRARGSALY